MPDVTGAELAQHARDLLLLPDALTCPLVVISGRTARFQAFYELAQPGFRAAGAVTVEVPFFGYASGPTAEALLKPLLRPAV